MGSKPWPRPLKSLMLCRICGEMKPEDAYTPSNWRDAITRSKCRQCMSDYHAERYHHRGWKGKVLGDLRRRQDAVNAIKSARGCRECGEKHAACLDFHHRDPMRKTLGIGTLVTRSTQLDKILREIELCDVLCSNCHRKLHWRQSRPRRAKVVTPKNVRVRQKQPKKVQPVEILRLA